MADVPPAVVTEMSTRPIEPAGEVAEQMVTVEQLTEVPGVLPKLTVVDPGTNPVPLMLTTVPPVGEPVVGVTAVTVGGLTAPADIAVSMATTRLRATAMASEAVTVRWPTCSVNAPPRHASGASPTGQAMRIRERAPIHLSWLSRQGCNTGIG